MPLNQRMNVTAAVLVASAAIDKLTNAQRIELRNECLDAGIKKLPRNLYYNYETQEWIEDARWPGYSVEAREVSHAL